MVIDLLYGSRVEEVFIPQREKLLLPLAAGRS
jgi:hypothetical protein